MIDMEDFSQLPKDQNFDYRFLRNKTERINWLIVGTDAATAANYGVIWIAPAACVVEDIWESHTVAGTNAGAVTLDLEKLTSTEALDAGDAILSAALSLKTTANTPQRGVPGATIANRQLARGDRLALKDAGTLTDVAGVTVLITVKYKL